MNAKRRSRTDPIAILNRVAGRSYERNRNAWDRAMHLLNLPTKYQVAVAEVLRDGRWRTADNPKAYVAKAACNTMLHLGLADMVDRAMGVRRIRSNCSEPVVNDSMFPRRFNDSGEEVNFLEFYDESPDPPDDTSDDLRGEIRASVPPWLRYKGRPFVCQGFTFPPSKHPTWARDNESSYLQLGLDLLFEEPLGIDWDLVTRMAVRKAVIRPAVAAVLSYSLDYGVSRTEAIRRARSSEAKAAIDAAWKWVNRNMKTISAVLQSNSALEARARLGIQEQFKTTPKPSIS